MDLTNLFKLPYSYSSKYKDFIKLKLVEKKTIKKNKKIIFNVKSNLTFKIFDFKWKIPRAQNIKRLRLVLGFPKIKLIGKKLKTRFVNFDDTIKFFLIRLLEKKI